MTSAETVVDTYIRSVTERDATKRFAMLEQCFTDDARFVTRGSVLIGRDAIAAMIAKFVDDPTSGTIRVKAIDARGRSFRFAVINERSDGSTLEVFDAGELADDARIKLILTFNGPLSAE